MFNKNINTITIDDIENLVNERKERENSHLDYKESIGNDYPAKREFLKDVTGFANGSGGYMILGVSEKDGLPREILGIDRNIGNQKIDEWIENVLLSNIDERVIYRTQTLEYKDGKVLMIIEIPESHKKPHMVTLEKKNIYYVRNNTVTDPAQHSQVRDMFDFSKNTRNKVEEFLKKRLDFDSLTSHFTMNKNASSLTNKSFDKIPLIIISITPMYLEMDRVLLNSKEMNQWLLSNSQVVLPYDKSVASIFPSNKPKILLESILYSNETREEDQQKLCCDYYFELFANGAIEDGLSKEVFLSNLMYSDRTQDSMWISLASLVDHIWRLYYFAKQYYEKINYLEEVVFQISSQNVQNISLRTQGNSPVNRLIPGTLPFSRDNSFNIMQKFTVGKLSDEIITEHIEYFAEKLSNAFGVQKAECFDDKGQLKLYPEQLINRY